MTISLDKPPVQSDPAEHQYPDSALLGMHDALLCPAVPAHPVDLADPYGSSSEALDSTRQEVSPATFPLISVAAAASPEITRVPSGVDYDNPRHDAATPDA